MRVWGLISNVDDVVEQYGFDSFDDQTKHPEYEFVLIDYVDMAISTADGFAVWYRGKKLELPDAFWPMLTNTDAMCLEHMLVEAGCPSILDLEEVAVARSKLRTYQRLAAHGIRVPKTVAFFTHPNQEFVKSSLGFPMVVKPDNGYGGAGVALLHNPDEFNAYLAHPDPGVVYVAQEYIASSKGRDMRVGFLNGEYLYSVVRQASDPDEFRSNAHVGGSVTPCEVDEQTLALCSRIAGLFNLPLIAIDLLYGEDGFVVTEVNTYPGMPDAEMKHMVAATIISDFARRSEEDPDD